MFLAGLALAALLTVVCVPAAGLRPPPVSPPPGSSAEAEERRLAGTVAGEGRTHPGRGEEPSEEASPSPAPPVRPSPRPRVRRGSGLPPPGDVRADGAEPPAPPARPPLRPPPAAAVRADDGRGGPARTPDPVLRVLPLGTGMALTGLGLGFFALRLRRR